MLKQLSLVWAPPYIESGVWCPQPGASCCGSCPQAHYRRHPRSSNDIIHRPPSFAALIVNSTGPRATDTDSSSQATVVCLTIRDRHTILERSPTPRDSFCSRHRHTALSLGVPYEPSILNHLAASATSSKDGGQRSEFSHVEVHTVRCLQL